MKTCRNYHEFASVRGGISLQAGPLRVGFNCTFLKQMLSSVNNDGRNLLIHENQDGRQQSGNDGGGDGPVSVL